MNGHRRITRTILRKVGFAMLVFPIALWATDRQAGTWKMNMEKSKFANDMPAPKGETVVIEEQEGGLKVVSNGLNAEGKPTHFEYSVKYDGKDYPVTGSPAVDAVAVKKINDSTIETIRKKNGVVVTTNTSVISKDGKTRTNTFHGKNANGEPRTWTAIFDKQ
jgi:hypothetical protein